MATLLDSSKTSDRGRTLAPPPLDLRGTPTGALCNLDCEYRLSLPKPQFYAVDRAWMSDEVLDSCLGQLGGSDRDAMPQDGQEDPIDGRGDCHCIALDADLRGYPKGTRKRKEDHGDHEFSYSPEHALVCRAICC